MKQLLGSIFVAVLAIIIIETSAMGWAIETRTFNNSNITPYGNLSNVVTCDPATNTTTFGQRFSNRTCNIGCKFAHFFQATSVMGCLTNGNCTCYRLPTAPTTAPVGVTMPSASGVA